MKLFNPTACCYCIAFKHEKEEKIEVGAIGVIKWPSGWLYYVGRASRGWPSRVKRFNKPSTKSFWHIDYLAASPKSTLRALLPVAWPASDECRLVDLIAQSKDCKPLTAGLGASDCKRGCAAHAFVSEQRPSEIFTDISDGRASIPGWIEFSPKSCRWRLFT